MKQDESILTKHPMMEGHSFSATFRWSIINPVINYTYEVKPEEPILIHILEPFQVDTIAKDSQDIEIAVLEAYICYLKASR